MKRDRLRCLVPLERSLTGWAQCFLPAMVAFTLFSMEKTAIPIAVNRESLLAMLGVLGVLTVILFNCVDFIVDKGGGLGRSVKGFVLRLSSVPLQKPEDVLV